MPFVKGQKKIGGRTKGSTNKDPLALEARAKARGCDVFDIALDFATGNFKALGYDAEVYHVEKPDGSVKMGYVITPEMRLKATMELMKYIYPAKKAIEISGGGEPITIRVLDYSAKPK